MGSVTRLSSIVNRRALEGSQLLGEIEPPSFTHYMVEGLRTGAVWRLRPSEATESKEQLRAISSGAKSAACRFMDLRFEAVTKHGDY